MTDVDVLDPVVAPNPQHSFEIAPKWDSNSMFSGSNQVYGLKLPRRIESTQHTRKQQMVDRPVEDIRLLF